MNNGEFRMLNKRDIINFLFLTSFPFFGIGAYVSGGFSPSVGYIVGITPHLLIILFYLVDLIYKSDIKVKVNWFYSLVLLFQLTCVASLFVSLSKNMPAMNMIGNVTKSISLVVPFQAFVIVFLYNENHRENFVKLTFWSFTFLLLINLIGFYGLGLTNEVHSIAGRLAMPFLDGFYSGAGLLAILNLMIVSLVKKSQNDPVRLTYLIGYFAVNLLLLYYINSRLAIFIFLGVFILFAFNLMRRFRGVFLLSVFTLPILLNVGVVIFYIMSLPMFVAVMQRVNLVDATTFNGRSFLWQRAFDWMIFDQRGLLFGNGSSGHYFLHLIPDYAKKFGFTGEQNLHLHSTTLMTIVDQGIFGLVLLLVLSYRIFAYYRTEFQKNSPDSAFFAAVVFLIFVMQVDTFCYLGSLGYVILCLLAARVSVNTKAV
jgi:O-antigen ligase